jgi:hypothetical protein
VHFGLDWQREVVGHREARLPQDGVGYTVPGDRKEADLLTRLGDPPGDGAPPTRAYPQLNDGDHPDIFRVT